MKPDDRAIEHLRQKAWSEIDEYSNAIWNVALAIHARPEVAFQEVETVRLLTNALEESGFSVEKGIAALPTAFRGVTGGTNKCEGPVVALLAEYDALPGLGHACGHHIIAASTLGAALGLLPIVEKVGGRLVVLGTPGEESGGGKIQLLEAGFFDDVDVAMLVHPGDMTWSMAEYLALQNCKVSFRGKAAHAVLNPERGINALDALSGFLWGINVLRGHLEEGTWINAVVREGGDLPNIIPERASADVQVRARTNEGCLSLVDKLERIAEGSGLITGAEPSVSLVGRLYRTLVPNVPLARAYESYVERLGFPCVSSLGICASTDMGNVSWKLPVLHPHIAVVEERGAALHTRAFHEVSCLDPARTATIAAAKVLASIALDLWLCDTFFVDVKKDFEQRTSST